MSERITSGPLTADNLIVEMRSEHELNGKPGWDKKATDWLLDYSYAKIGLEGPKTLSLIAQIEYWVDIEKKYNEIKSVINR